jgi:hypothetical protein
MNIEDALRASPDESPSPFFASRVMRSVREPVPIAFPWRRLVFAVTASVVAIGITVAARPVADAAMVISFVVVGIAATGVGKLLSA